MPDHWKTLQGAGVPDGEIRSPPHDLDLATVRAAVKEFARAIDQLAPARREPLLAWLRAWRHHWPASFSEHLGGEGESLVAGLSEMDVDANRYLKLRRIAIENLSNVL